MSQQQYLLFEEYDQLEIEDLNEQDMSCKVKDSANPLSFEFPISACLQKGEDEFWPINITEANCRQFKFNIIGEKRMNPTFVNLDDLTQDGVHPNDSVEAEEWLQRVVNPILEAIVGCEQVEGCSIQCESYNYRERELRFAPPLVELTGPNQHDGSRVFNASGLFDVLAIADELLEPDEERSVSFSLREQCVCFEGNHAGEHIIIFLHSAPQADEPVRTAKPGEWI